MSSRLLHKFGHQNKNIFNSCSIVQKVYLGTSLVGIQLWMQFNAKQILLEVWNVIRDINYRDQNFQSTFNGRYQRYKRLKTTDIKHNMIKAFWLGFFKFQYLHFDNKLALQRAYNLHTQIYFCKLLTALIRLLTKYWRIGVPPWELSMIQILKACILRRGKS